MSDVTISVNGSKYYVSRGHHKISSLKELAGVEADDELAEIKGTLEPLDARGETHIRGGETFLSRDRPASACPQQWKLDLNDRYQRAVGTITSLSTAAIVAPVLFAREVSGATPGVAIRGALNWWVYGSWILLTASVLGAIVYYYGSAKWVKLAWQRPTDMFRWPVEDPFVESVLDVSYFVMMVGFVLGVACVVMFMVTFR